MVQVSVSKGTRGRFLDNSNEGLMFQKHIAGILVYVEH